MENPKKVNNTRGIGFQLMKTDMVMFLWKDSCINKDIS